MVSAVSDVTLDFGGWKRSNYVKTQMNYNNGFEAVNAEMHIHEPKHIFLRHEEEISGDTNTFRHSCIHMQRTSRVNIKGVVSDDEVNL